MISNIETIITDLNGVLMFGHDRLNDGQPFYQTYRQLGGSNLTEDSVCEIVKSIVARFTDLYGNRKYDDQFPSISNAINDSFELPEEEVKLLADVIAHHEIGFIEPSTIARIQELSKTYQLVLLSNIWSDSSRWVAYFEQIGIAECFDTLVFSSDVGINKPSTKIFDIALQRAGADSERCVMVGDDYERDIVPAKTLGMSTLWVSDTDRTTGFPMADATIGSFTSIHEVVTSKTY